MGDAGTDGGARRGRRTVVRRSGVHGRGVFAARDLAAGEEVIEYAGERITLLEAELRGLQRPNDPGFTTYFWLESGDVLDASVNGNSARYINHSCDPNCEAVEDERERIVIRTLRGVAAGEELSYDYRLELPDGADPHDEDFACRCGSPRCRGTMLDDG